MDSRKDPTVLSDKIIDLVKAYNCNCAEAMIKVMAERFGFDPGMSRLGTVFGAGISGNADLCGFLTGGLIVIGLKFGRTDCDDKDRRGKCQRVGAEYYKWFMKTHGRCCDIKGDPTVGPYDDCHQVGREAVLFLADLVQRNKG